MKYFSLIDTDISAVLLPPVGVLGTVIIHQVSFCIVNSSTETLHSHNNWSHRCTKLILVDGDLVKSERSVTQGLEECISPKTAGNVNKSVDSKYTVNRIRWKTKQRMRQMKRLKGRPWRVVCGNISANVKLIKTDQTVQYRERGGGQMSHFLALFLFGWQQSCVHQGRHQQGEHPAEQWKQWEQVRQCWGGYRQQQSGLTGRPEWPHWANPQTQKVQTQPYAGAAHRQPGRTHSESLHLFTSAPFMFVLCHHPGRGSQLLPSIIAPCFAAFLCSFFSSSFHVHLMC